MKNKKRHSHDEAMRWLEDMESELRADFLTKHPDFGERLMKRIEDRERVKTWLGRYEFTVQQEMDQAFPKLKQLLSEAIDRLPSPCDSPGKSRGSPPAAGNAVRIHNSLVALFGDVETAQQILNDLVQDFVRSAAKESESEVVLKEQEVQAQISLLQEAVEMLSRCRVRGTKRQRALHVRRTKYDGEDSF